MNRHGQGWWCAPAHRITRLWLLSTHRRGRQWNNESMVTVHAPAWTRVVGCAGTPNSTEQRVDGYCLRTGVDDSGITSRWLLCMHRHGRGWWCAPAHRITRLWLLPTRRRGRQWWCAPAHRITRLWLLSTHRRGLQWNNESMVPVRAPAWTRVVVCTGTPNNTE